MVRCKWIRAGTAALILIAGSGFCQRAAAFVPGACAQDAEKLCPGVADKEMVPCLKQHQDQVSTTCKTNLAEAREAVRDLKDACEEDIHKFCAEVKPGGGRIRRCLREHKSELSSGCQSTITEVKKKFKTAIPESDHPAPPAGSK